MIRRFHDWPTRMAEALLVEEKVPFAWGESDCSMFAANVIKAIRGDDIFERYRGRYKTERGAYRIAKGHPENVVEKIIEDHPLQPINPDRAQRGDLLAIRQNEENALCIVSLDPRYIVGKKDADEPPYITMIDRDRVEIIRAWRV